jgi:xanthine dehydrogenase accessory factor
MKKLFSDILETLKNGQDIVLVSVINNSGSTPRNIGARMAVRKDGTISGTIGGELSNTGQASCGRGT